MSRCDFVHEDLRSRSLNTDDLRRDVAALTVRVERFEERQSG